jgi:O-antigen ligase
MHFAPLVIFSSSLYKNREEDLLTGRGSINNYALSFFERNPLFGSLSEDMDMTSLVHNFLLRQLASFGIIGSFPIVLLYIYMLFYIVKVSLKSSVNITNIGFFFFLLQLIISLVEPTFPFAPGTGVVFSYILLGYSLYQRSIIIE